MELEHIDSNMREQSTIKTTMEQETKVLQEHQILDNQTPLLTQKDVKQESITRLFFSMVSYVRCSIIVTAVIISKFDFTCIFSQLDLVGLLLED